MLYFSTFIIIYEDRELPEPNFFLPSYWDKEDIKITGDYYHTNADSRWNSLQLLKRKKVEMTCGFTLDIYRKESMIGKTMEVDALKVYASQFEQNWFAHEEFAGIKTPAVAKMTFVSISSEEYKEFLQTVYQFLKHTSGLVVHVLNREYNAEEFRSYFIS